ncbi:TPA: CHASE9 sensor domain-containing protein, partial [Escherichia coli]|nr:CHASE9 sensor domain-containing protein [Escherichia coli]
MLVFFKKKFNGVFFIILVIFLAVGVFSRYIYFRDYERLFLDIQTDTKIFQITSYFDQIEREGDSLIDATFHLHNDVNISAALRHRLSKSPFISAVGWVAKDGRFFYYENSNGESY